MEVTGRCWASLSGRSPYLRSLCIQPCFGAPPLACAVKNHPCADRGLNGFIWEERLSSRWVTCCTKHSLSTACKVFLCELQRDRKLSHLIQGSSYSALHERPLLLLLLPLGAWKEKYKPHLGLRKKGNCLIFCWNASFEMDPTLKASGKRLEGTFNDYRLIANER